MLITGEITSKAVVDAELIARDTLCRIGYDRASHGMDGRTVEVLNKISSQSPEIANAVSKEGGDIGAGDQGMCFGYACAETPAFMPLAHHLSFEIINLLQGDINVRLSKNWGQDVPDWNSVFLPDAKSQVTIEYDDSGKARRVDTVVVSTCHKPGLTMGDLRGQISRVVIDPIRRKWSGLFDDKTKWLINPAGLWTIGGPAADTGLSGRKIVVDNYGSDSVVGGGSYSGKCSTKVDRSGAYMARYVAKNLVAAGVSSKVQLQVAYAIGVAEPVSLRILCDRLGKELEHISEIVKNTVSFSPKGIIDRLNLRRPIYAATATGGHFGRNEFPWEKLDLVDIFKKI